MAAETNFSHTGATTLIGGTRTDLSKASPQQEILMTGQTGKYTLASIPWGEFADYEKFPPGWIFKGMEVGFARNSDDSDNL